MSNEGGNPYSFFESFFDILGRVMSEIIFLVENAVEGGFTARALNESIFTEGDDLDALRANIRDAVDCHFEQGEKPKMIRLHFSSEEVIAA